MLALAFTCSLAVAALPSAGPPVNVVLVADWARGTRLSPLAGPPFLVIERALIQELVRANPEVNFGVVAYDEAPRVLMPLPPARGPNQERAAVLAELAASLANTHVEGLSSHPAAALQRAEEMLRAADPQGELPRLIVLLATKSGYEGDELLGLPLQRARADAVLQDSICALAQAATPVLLMSSAVYPHGVLRDRLQQADVAPAYDATAARKAFQAALESVQKVHVRKPPAAECDNAHALAQMDFVLLHDVVTRVGESEFYIPEASVDARAVATPFTGCMAPTAGEWLAAAQRPGFVPASVPERLAPAPANPNKPLFVTLDGNQPVWSTKPVRTSVQRCAWPSDHPVLSTATKLALTPLYTRREVGAPILRQVPLGAEVLLMSELMQGWRWVRLADGAQGWMREAHIQPSGPNLPALVRETMSAAVNKPTAANLRAAAVGWRVSGIPEGAAYAEDYQRVADSRDPAQDSFAELDAYKFRALMGLYPWLNRKLTTADDVCGRLQATLALREQWTQAQDADQAAAYERAFAFLPELQVCRRAPAWQGRASLQPLRAAASRVPQAVPLLAALADAEKACDTSWLEVPEPYVKGCVHAAEATRRLKTLSQAWSRSPQCMRDLLQEPLTRAAAQVSRSLCWCDSEEATRAAWPDLLRTLRTATDWQAPLLTQNLEQVQQDPNVRFACEGRER